MNFAMTECKQEVFEFQVHGSRKVTGDFSGGYLSSAGGAVRSITVAGSFAISSALGSYWVIGS